MEKISKKNQLVKETFEEGYDINREGDLIRKDGSIKNLFRLAKNGYLFVSLRLPTDERGQVSIHKLQAYKKFGEKMFEKGIVVRHLDGNRLNNSFDNIEIGTFSQNQLDRDKDELKIHALKAARAKQNMIRPLEIRLKIYEMLYQNYPTREIMDKYSIAKSTLYNMKKNSIEYNEFKSNIENALMM